MRWDGMLKSVEGGFQKEREWYFSSHRWNLKFLGIALTWNSNSTILLYPANHGMLRIITFSRSILWLVENSKIVLFLFYISMLTLLLGQNFIFRTQIVIPCDGKNFLLLFFFLTLNIIISKRAQREKLALKKKKKFIKPKFVQPYP